MDVKFDTKGFDELKKQFASFATDQQRKDVVMRVAKEVLARHYVRVVENTPVKTGTLQTNWQLGKLTYTGKAVVGKVTNEIVYTPYVEFGHRQGKNGFIKGAHMVKLSENKIEKDVLEIAVKELQKAFRRR